MSSVFEGYSRYYDLLYGDKDYAAEVDYTLSRINRYGSSARRILELGCGTGAHAEHLARLGFIVDGVDVSESMLARAETRRRGLPIDVAERVTFSQGDVRSIRLAKRYDAVVSLFHVMSYQTSDDDLDSALSTAAAHLVPGGVLMFDFWYGPAVLTQKPEVRVKRLAENGIEVTRIAEPVLRTTDNVVDVHYEIWITNRHGGVERVNETHNMRYWFVPEIILHLDRAGFECCAIEAWLSDQPPSVDSWAACATTRLR